MGGGAVALTPPPMALGCLATQARRAVTLSPSRPDLRTDHARDSVEGSIQEPLGTNARLGTGGNEGDFPSTAPAANPVFYRTYSRRTPSGRESWLEVAERNLDRKSTRLNSSHSSVSRMPSSA